MNRGILLAIASSLTFSFMNILLKLTGLKLPMGEIAFARGFIGLTLALVLMYHKKIRLSKQDLPLLILRGLLGGGYVLVYIYVLQKMRMGDVAILAQLSGVFVLFWNAVILKEKISPAAYMPLVGISLGTVLIIRPENLSTNIFPALLMIGAEIIDGLIIILVRYLAASERHNSYEIMFYFLFCTTIMSTPFFASTLIIPSSYNFLALILLGLISFLALTFLTKAFAKEKAPLVEFARYSGIVFNMLWGYFVFNEVPTLRSVGGGLLITICLTKILRVQKG